MPVSSDSIPSLSPGMSRSLSRLGEQRTRTQLLLVLGITQIALGSVIVAVSFAALAITNSAKIRHSCPFWAGFSVLLAGLIGVISWKRPVSLVVSFFTLLSVVCVMLSLAGSILSCQNAQTIMDLEACEKIGFEGEGMCMCCDRMTQRDHPELCGAVGKLLKLHHFQDCRTVRLALRDLLFGVCGLSILSTIVCTLSTVVCCIQMFTVDMLHVLVPQRSQSVNAECPSAHGHFLQRAGDPDEFIHPVPPPPYYPPEYTCSSETDAQSITYNGSMDSPAPLYPTDFPPPYEAVVGNSTTSQFDPQLTEISNSSFCEHILSTAFSGEGSMDSGSLMMSEIIDIPDDSSFSEDSCLVMAMQGGSQAMGCGPGMPESWAQEAELSPARSRACAWTGRSFSCSSPGRYSSGPGPGTLSQSCEMLETAAAAIASGPRTYSTSSDTSALQAGPESPCPSQRYNQSPGPQAPSRTLAPHRLSRSNSDPAICGSTATSAEGNRNWKTAEDEMSQTSTDTAQCSEACLLPTSRHGTPELFHCATVSKQRQLVKSRGLPALTKEGARSLSDLKVYRGTRLLVTRFLQRSKRNLTAEPWPTPAGAAGAAGTSKSRVDRGSTGSSCEQASRNPWAVGVRQRVRQDGIHLRSCGDVSSSTLSLRRLFSTNRLDNSRPHSLVVVYRETVL
ncbi:protein ENTREP2-like [Chiloscyllium punctatum]